MPKQHGGWGWVKNGGEGRGRLHFVNFQRIRDSDQLQVMGIKGIRPYKTETTLGI